MECTLECNFCSNNYCLLEHLNEINKGEKLKKEIEECNTLINGIKEGNQYYGVTLKGLLHKKNILTEEMMKYEKYY